MDFFKVLFGMIVPVLYVCTVNKKEEILQAALNLLIDKGIHATPMSAIAKAANTGMGTIYNYFPNKEVLLNAIYVDIKNAEAVCFKRDSKELPVKTQFEIFYKATLNFFIVHPQYFKFMQQMNPSPIITEASREVGRSAIKEVYHLLEIGQQQRIVKQLPIEELLQFIGGSVVSFLNWYFRDKTTKKNERIANQLTMIWDAIRE